MKGFWISLYNPFPIVSEVHIAINIYTSMKDYVYLCRPFIMPYTVYIIFKEEME